MSTKKLELKVVEDSLGQVHVPVQAHWSTRTARWLEQSKHLDGRFQELAHPLLIDGLLQVFKAKLGARRERDNAANNATASSATAGSATASSATASSATAGSATVFSAAGGSIGPDGADGGKSTGLASLARIKSQVCDEILSGQWRQEILVDPLLTPAGEALLDNINELITGRSAEIMGVNRESLNEQCHLLSGRADSLDLLWQDCFVAATKLALLTATRELSSALLDLERLLRRKSLEIEKHLRDQGREEEHQLIAAREFNNFGNTAERIMRRLTEGRERLLGVSFRADRLERQSLVSELNLHTGLKIRGGEEVIGSGNIGSSLADLVSVTSILKELSIDLIKVCQSLRRLNDVESGAPAIAALMTSCLKVQGAELAVCLALQTSLSEDGTPALSLAANTLLKAIDQIRAAVRNFNQSCIARVSLRQ